ncbi:MAG: hypothetical protein ACFCUS_03330 [Rubrimonas sp.]|uniref:hypothetical protein n=1 Tax=Rubrimonas sp. TaxID=2036015 RepID=UPI002FDE9853
MVHEHLPHAFMAGVLLLPLAAACDKTEAAVASFGHAVRKLRERTGRLDAALAGHAARCDRGFVGLYVDAPETAGPARGVARFFDVADAPPRRGRPVVAATLSREEVARRIVARAMDREAMVWADPEPDE